MKALKHIISAVLFLAFVVSCTEDEFGNTKFVSTAVAPTNVSALFTVTQDNTGQVTITPISDGAVSYEIYFGDETTDPAKVKQGQNIVHTFAEGTYEVKIVAIGISGLKSEATKQLEVSFKAPENLEVVIENDPAISKQVNVTATADFAVTFDVYFGEEGNDTPVTGNIGETVSYVYSEPGTYSIKVVAKGAAIETTEYSVDFEVTEILQPINAAPTPPTRNEVDVVSIFSDKYTNITVNEWNPGWGQSTVLSSFDVEGDNILKYDYLNYTGIVTDYGNPTDLSSMEYVHFDYWTNDAEFIGFKIVNTTQPDGSPEKESEITISEITAGEWVSVDIPLSDFTTDMSAITQMLFVSNGVTVFIDNLYFWRQPSAIPTGVVGRWKLAPIAGALKVGPNPNDGSWWATTLDDVTTRACYFDDEYVFNEDGTFLNVLGTETWTEAWQGGSDSCGTPVYPHDGSIPASYTYDDMAGTLTLNGTGAYLGLPKAYNGGELSNPADAPASITYDITLSNNDTEMTVVINIGGGYWTYELIKESTSSPIEGTWKLAPEAYALKVGPDPYDGSWWASSEDDITARACYFDDEYVFNSDGTFVNNLGTETWVETWQSGNPDGCGTPVAPHDGSASATFTFNELEETVTLNGKGAYLGLPKAFNGGELANPADAPDSITYVVTFSDNNNTMTVLIDIGGGYWTYKFVKI